VLRAWAPTADRDNCFPSASVDALRQLGLLGYFIPPELGGVGGSVRTYCDIAATLGEECLSTAVTWAMHCQQVAVLVDGSFAGREAVLADVARNGVLVASVTTEAEKGSELLKAHAPVAEEEGRLRIVRHAPIVSYGAEAGYFLLTMKAGAADGPTVLVLVARGDGEIEVVGEWRAMGMRGTQSAPMRFDVVVDRDHVVGESFRELAVRTMIPIGHLGWAACWFGAARGLLGRVVRHLRAAAAKQRRDITSDALRQRLASLRLSLDLVEAMIATVATRLDAVRDGVEPPDRCGEVGFTIMVNNVKVAGSQLCVAVVDGLMDVAGLFDGYLEEGDLGLERVFRDVRSAPLMYHNDRLLRANGSLLFVEGSRLHELW
jgi:acyl-CoA dehydrogenase